MKSNPTSFELQIELVYMMEWFKLIFLLKRTISKIYLSYGIVGIRKEVIYLNIVEAFYTLLETQWYLQDFEWLKKKVMKV